MYGLQEGEGVGWIGTDIYTLLILCIKWTTNENLLYRTGTSTLPGDLKEPEIHKKGDICKHIADLLGGTAETNCEIAVLQ